MRAFQKSNFSVLVRKKKQPPTKQVAGGSVPCSTKSAAEPAPARDAWREDTRAPAPRRAVADELLHAGDAG